MFDDSTRNIGGCACIEAAAPAADYVDVPHDVLFLLYFKVHFACIPNLLKNFSSRQKPVNPATTIIMPTR